MSYYDEDPYAWEDDEQITIILKFSAIKSETKRAWLVEFGVGFEADEAWLPKSQCTMVDAETIEVPEWLVLEKGLEEYEV